MNGFDDLVARLTQRLSADDELRQDVAKELRAHLEDSQADFLHGGYSEAEARIKAAAALGDEKLLADQLWQANFRRMRLRKVARWAVGLLLPPATIAVIAGLLLYLLPLIVVPILVSGGPMGMPAPWLEKLSLQRHIEATDRFLFDNDSVLASETKDAARIVAHDPENPVYYGNYVVTLVSQSRDANPNTTLAAIDHGAKLDPENAFYNWEKAGYLAAAAGSLANDPQRKYRIDIYPSTRSGSRFEPYKVFQLKDADLLGQSLDQICLALTKPRYATPSLEMLQRRLQAMPNTRLSQYFWRAAVMSNTPLPARENFRSLAAIFGSQAVEAIKTGRPEEGWRTLRTLELAALQFARTSDTWVGIFTGAEMYQQTLAYQELAYRELGKPDLAQPTEERRLEDRRDRVLLRGQGHEDFEKFSPHMGLYWAYHLPTGMHVPQLNFAPLRQAEYVVVYQTALGMLLLWLFAALLAAGAGLLILRLLGRRKPIPKARLLFVGWRRLGTIYLLSIVLPLGAYVLYLLSPLARREYGLNVPSMMVQVLAELILVSVSVFCLLTWLSVRAILQRARDAGLDVSSDMPPRRSWPVALLVLAMLYVAISVALAISTWNQQVSADTGWTLAVSALVVLTVLTGIAAALAAFPRKIGQPLFRTALLSLLPILAVGIIVVGSAGGLTLAWAEHSVMSQVRGNAELDIHAELELSNFGQLRQHYAELYQRQVSPCSQPAGQAQKMASSACAETSHR